MLRARIVLIAAIVGAAAAPTLSVVTPTQPVARFSAAPRAVASQPRPIDHEVVATLTEVPAATTTTAASRPKPRPAPKPVGDGKNDTNKVDTRPKPTAAGLPLGSPFIGKYTGTEIEGYARYEGQTTCDPTPKLGTVALRDALLARFPNTTSLGMSRGCDVGGQSEHKEGRAFDWGASVTNAAQVAAVNDFLTALFATDAAGHPYALARRMGVMYVIWNQQIWSPSNAAATWKAYTGDNPHTDHVHVSLSWAGARAETSFWSGVVTVPERPVTTSTTRRPRTTTTTRPATTSTTRRPRLPQPSTSTTTAPTSSTSTSSTAPPPTTTTTTLA